MTDTSAEDTSDFGEDVGEDNGDGTFNVPASVFRRMREAANKGQSARRDLDTFKRENAFLKAGVDLDDPKGKLLVRGYDGEIDPEAIKKAAIEYGVIPNPEAKQDGDEGTKDGQQADQGADAGEQQSADKIAQAATGGTAPNKGTDRVTSMEQFLKDGGSIDDFAAHLRSMGEPVIEG